jgi:hypothetical protein
MSNFKQEILMILALIIAALFCFLVLATDTPTSVPMINDRIQVPAGYTFLDASAFGRFQGYPTWYCKQNETGRIFICTNGEIGSELIFPEGYQFLGASAWGEFTSYPTYYCKNIKTDEVFTCDPVVK